MGRPYSYLIMRDHIEEKTKADTLIYFQQFIRWLVICPLEKRVPTSFTSESVQFLV